jgi:hypothetical protein
MSRVNGIRKDVSASKSAAVKFDTASAERTSRAAGPANSSTNRLSVSARNFPAASASIPMRVNIKDCVRSILKAAVRAIE